jgi:hypothetical protein|tara:strand:- start:369 stop:587 length:219 start_codon:yes stop_codon:yes gene_type:complete
MSKVHEALRPEEYCCDDCDYWGASPDVCPHKNMVFQAYEPDTNVQENYFCDDCGKEFDIPEPDEDTMRGEDR